MSQNESSTSSSKSNARVDEELSELLDSALEDFSTSDTAPEKLDSKAKCEKPDESNLGANDEWSDEFIKQAAQNFDPNFLNMLRLSGQSDASSLNEDQLKQGFEQMAAAAQVFLSQDGGEMSSDFAATISQAVQELSSGANAKNDVVGDGDPNAFIPPFMQGMMQSLLSKEVLHPSLKDVLDSFPEYLETNKDKLSDEDKFRYDKQQELMRLVCDVLEEEKETDSEEVRLKRFDRVMNLMQKLQEYGQPPKELVGDVGPTPDMKNCCLM